jgi:hypothetical protein
LVGRQREFYFSWVPLARKRWAICLPNWCLTLSTHNTSPTPPQNHRIMKCCHQHKKSAGNGNNVLHFTIGLSGVDLFLFFLLFHMYHDHFHLLPIHSITSYYLHPTSIHALFIFLLFLLLIDKIILKKMTFFCWWKSFS